MADIDLDALRAKRLEGVESRTITLGGREWELHPEVPFEVGEAYAAGKRRRAFGLLLADMSELDEFMGHRPTSADFFAILDMFGTSSGESGAS